VGQHLTGGDVPKRTTIHRVCVGLETRGPAHYIDSNSYQGPL